MNEEYNPNLDPSPQLKPSKFPENEYRKAVIQLSEIGKFVQNIDVRELAEIKLFIMHYIQILGSQLRDLRHIIDLQENPNKISSEVTPVEKSDKPKLIIPGTEISK